MIQDCECIVLVMYVVCGFVVVNDLRQGFLHLDVFIY